VEFIESPVFTRLLHEYHALQIFLAEAPGAGALIPGTGGFRKMRWTDPRRSKGKPGGLRVIYYCLSEDLQIWFLAIYDKDEADAQGGHRARKEGARACEEETEVARCGSSTRSPRAGTSSES